MSAGLRFIKPKKESERAAVGVVALRCVAVAVVVLWVLYYIALKLKSVFFGTLNPLPIHISVCIVPSPSVQTGYVIYPRLKYAYTVNVAFALELLSYI